MTFADLPQTAAWVHQEARAGFEVVYFHRLSDGHRIEGCTTAVEEGEPWIVRYDITVDSSWSTRTAVITGHYPSGTRSVTLSATGAGEWRVDGEPAPHLDGCLDVDLESCIVTNTLPAHRLNLSVGGRASAPAAYVHAADLAVDRQEQGYARATHLGFDYSAPALQFTARLEYDESGLVVSYPGLATRAH